MIVICVSVIAFNPLNIGRLFHGYMLAESVCQFRVSDLFCRFYSYILHYVAFDLGLHCLPMTLLQVSR